MPQLFIRESGKRDEEIREVDLALGETTIGRSVDCDLHLDNQTISRRHASLASTSQGYVLTDLGSANGTWVNGKKITRHLLRHEDSICFGGAVAVFHEPPDPDATLQIDVKALLEVGHRTAALRIKDLEFDEPMTRPDPPARARPRRVVAPASLTRPSPPTMPPPLPATKLPRPAPPPNTAGEHRLQRSSPPPQSRQPGSAAGVGGRRFAGFWIRVGAWLVDSVILGIVSVALTVVFGIAIGALGSQAPSLQIYLMPISLAVGFLLPAIYLLVGWARYGQTLGKMVCGLRIVRENGAPIGFGGALLRLFGYMLSSLIFGIGYLMVAFTDRNRGLHDMVAGTVVVRER